MWGAIVGDIAGSRFEGKDMRSKQFALFHGDCRFTDDSVMTVAVARAVMEHKSNGADLSTEAIKLMQWFGRMYQHRGYGGNFIDWIWSDNPAPYNSMGNGAAMRVSACGFAAETLVEAKEMAYAVTAVSHNHPEGIRGAQAVASAIFMARTGAGKDDIRQYITDNFYKIDFEIDDLREYYQTDVSCQGSVPQAIASFLESQSFEDAIRNAISIGGDSDTIAAIAGSIADAYYGVPQEFINRARHYVSFTMGDIINRFEQMFPQNK